jgi:thioredoxin-like negative regulator of GroEL
MKYLALLLALLKIHQLSAFATNCIQSSSRQAAERSKNHALQVSTHHTTGSDTTPSPVDGIAKITSIHNQDDLFNFLAEDERLCVIKFYAGWCKSCAKFGLKYKQLAHVHGDIVDKSGTVQRNGEVRFAQMEYGENVRLVKSLGIKKLPFVQIYKASTGKIDEFVCGPRDFNEKVVTRVEELLAMSNDEIMFEKNMEDGQSLGDSIISSMNGEDADKAISKRDMK